MRDILGLACAPDAISWRQCKGGGIRRASFFKTSLLYTMENGATAEMGLTGNDGVVGIALFMGGGTMPNRAVVQSAGDAIRMKAKVLQNEFAFEW